MGPTASGAPNVAPSVAPPFGQLQERQQPSAPLAPRPSTVAPAQPPPSPGFGLGSGGAPTGAGVQPPPSTGPLALRPIVSTPSLPNQFVGLIDVNVDPIDVDVGLLWVYFMSISTAWPRSGKSGWPTYGGVACGRSGGPVAVDHDG
jgi:hypothetical protein